MGSSVFTNNELDSAAVSNQRVSHGCYSTGKHHESSQFVNLGDADFVDHVGSTPYLAGKDEEFTLTGFRGMENSTRVSHSASGVRLNKQNLVFKGKTGIGDSATPRNTSELSDQPDTDFTEVNSQFLHSLLFLYFFKLWINFLTFDNLFIFLHIDCHYSDEKLVAMWLQLKTFIQ